MSDTYSFQVYLAKNPDAITFGKWLWERMTPAERNEFLTLGVDGLPVSGLEVNLVNWGTSHIAFDYAKDALVNEWLAWYNEVPTGTRLLLYSAAASQAENPNLKNTVGARVLPAWVWQPVGSKNDASWFAAINPIRELQRRIYTRLSLPQLSDVFSSIANPNQSAGDPIPTDPANTNTDSGTNGPGSAFTDTPGAYGGTPAASSGGSSMLWLGLIVLGIWALSDE